VAIDDSAAISAKAADVFDIADMNVPPSVSFLATFSVCIRSCGHADEKEKQCHTDADAVAHIGNLKEAPAEKASSTRVFPESALDRSTSGKP
jgi:hypothetical protein